MASSPRIVTQTGTVRRRSSKREAHLAVHRPSACSGVKALRNTSDATAASRQAPLAFRSLDPFRALRELDRRRRDEERPFPLRTKNRLTGKAPYKSCANLIPRSARRISNRVSHPIARLAAMLIHAGLPPAHFMQRIEVRHALSGEQTLDAV